MAIVSRTQLKAWFRRGLKPLEVQFHSWIDSYWHKNDSIPMSSIEGLNNALNQRTISIDAALSGTSTNPVQNKVVKIALDGKAPIDHTHTIDSIPGLPEELNNKADNDTVDDLQRQIDLLAQNGPDDKEVVAVSTFDDLEDIENPSQEVIYKTLDTNKLYLYNGEEFEDVTGRPIDNTIYVTDISELLSSNQEQGLYSVLVITTTGNVTSVSATYSFAVTSVARLLQNKDGWAERITVSNAFQWSWHRYSYEGHTHAELSLAATRAYTLDFGTSSELIQDVNMLGAVTIDRIITRNVAHLYATYGNVSHQEVNLAQPVSLNIPNGTVITWEIVRTTDDELAAVGIRCNINTNA